MKALVQALRVSSELVFEWAVKALVTAFEASLDLVSIDRARAFDLARAIDRVRAFDLA